MNLAENWGTFLGSLVDTRKWMKITCRHSVLPIPLQSVAPLRLQQHVQSFGPGGDLCSEKPTHHHFFESMVFFHWLIYVDILLTTSWLGYIYPGKVVSDCIPIYIPIASRFVKWTAQVCWLNSFKRLSCCLNHVESHVVFIQFSLFSLLESLVNCSWEQHVVTMKNPRFLFMTSRFWSWWAPPVIKRGLLENQPFSSMIFPAWNLHS